MADHFDAVPLEIRDAAAAVLRTYGARAAGSAGCGHDAGPVVLASLAAATGAVDDGLGHAVVDRWLSDLPERLAGVGAFGGLGGFHAAARAVADLRPAARPLADLLVDQTARWLAGVRWRRQQVAWPDYDLFTGPAGLVLAGAAAGGTNEPFAPAADHLAQLCGHPKLPGLRAGPEIDPRSAFNIGRINTGLGHGVTGVASALRHAAETIPGADDHRQALGHACAWLVNEVHVDPRGLITWPPIGRDAEPPLRGVDRRQAWCYGTPGVAWTLWDAGRVLDNASLQRLAEAAMRSFCAVFDADFYIDNHDVSEALAICHGAAGTLAVADAFARHAQLTPAAVLRDQLADYLTARIEEVCALARTDITMLNGSGGIMSVLLTAYGAPRSWLSLVALR